ncbi:MAG TPA: MT-A70 family methyltransferase [Kiloniellales bacterium]
MPETEDDPMKIPKFLKRKPSGVLPELPKARPPLRPTPAGGLPWKRRAPPPKASEDVAEEKPRSVPIAEIRKQLAEREAEGVPPGDVHLVETRRFSPLGRIPPAPSGEGRSRSQAMPSAALTRLAADINAAHDRVKAAFGDSVAHAYRAGELLEQARRECRKQEVKWSDWLANACPDISGRTARLYKRTFNKVKALGGDSASLAVLADKSLENLDKAFRDPPADKAARRAATERDLAANIAQAALFLGSGPYGVIYADPPWRFEVRSRATGLDRAADNHYPTLTVPGLVEMRERIDQAAAADCALFLWTTVPFAGEAHRLIEAWGFAYKSQVAWIKDKTGTGYWFRNRHEILLLATRGEVPAPAMGEQAESAIEAPVAEHSRKPAVFREIIERYYPTLRKLELFARYEAGHEPEGWDVWGAEASAGLGIGGVGQACGPDDADA